MDSIHVSSLGRPTTKMGLHGSFSGESNLKGALFGDMGRFEQPEDRRDVVNSQHTAADFNVEYCHHEYYLFCTSTSLIHSSIHFILPSGYRRRSSWSLADENSSVLTSELVLQKLSHQKRARSLTSNLSAQTCMLTLQRKIRTADRSIAHKI